MIRLPNFLQRSTILLIIRAFSGYSAKQGQYEYVKRPSQTQMGMNSVPEEDKLGTVYSNWVLARSSSHNHNVAHFRRIRAKDRYNIHKLTNIQFMIWLGTHQHQYFLTLNEKIMLLAQINHVCNVLKRDKAQYNSFIRTIISDILRCSVSPDDLICLGTFVSVLVELGVADTEIWNSVLLSLQLRKYDYDYDYLFGLYISLYKYRLYAYYTYSYTTLRDNDILLYLPNFYRNSLEVLRQFIKCNVYNLKYVRLLCRCLYANSINYHYFWSSVTDWFNIYLKEQLSRRQLYDFLIVPEQSIEKILFDDGLIRPRSIIEEIAEIGYVLALNSFASWRMITFVYDLILYSIENGSDIYNRYLYIYRRQTTKPTYYSQASEEEDVQNEQYRSNLEQMKYEYKVVFINPIELSSLAIVHLLVTIKSIYDIEASYQAQEQVNRYDYTRKVKYVKNGVMKWLVVQLCLPERKYIIHYLLDIIKCSQLLSVMDINLKIFLADKVRCLRDYDCSFDDLKSILGHLEPANFKYLEAVLDRFLVRADPKNILLLTQLIEWYSMTKQQYEIELYQSRPGRDNVSNYTPLSPTSAHNEKQHQADFENNPLFKYISFKTYESSWTPHLSFYFLKLPKMVNSYDKYYSFDENCFFLHILYKNEVYWANYMTPEYLSELEKLKNEIKFSCSSRGFKLNMNSYFYKLLNYVDLVSFFDGG